MKHHKLIATITFGTFGLLASTGTLAAQDVAPPPPPSFSAGSGPGESVQPQPEPVRRPLADRLTVRPGTFITIRTGQMLSSDRNQQGDAFFGTLAEPIVVDGIVVAARGQQVTGRITETKKAGMVSGTSKLGLELAGITLMDGSQVSIQSQMIQRAGGTSVGRDAAAVGTTTAVGAAIGASADWGRGAAIGAGAGAAAGLAGVLLTRGHATEIYPETTLTFRLESAVAVDTTRAPQVYRYADSRDYSQPAYSQRPPALPQRAVGYPYPSYPRYYDPYWGPGYWGGSGVAIVVGPRYGRYRR